MWITGTKFKELAKWWAPLDGGVAAEGRPRLAREAQICAMDSKALHVAHTHARSDKEK